MTLAIMIGFAAILSFLSFRSTFFGMKLMAGMSWFVLWIYLKDNPPGAVIEGSGLHTALMAVTVGFGLMIVLSGLGKGIAKSQSRMDRGFQITEHEESGFHFKLPKWLTASNSSEERARNTDESNDNYRDILRRAYRRKGYK